MPPELGVQHSDSIDRRHVPAQLSSFVGREADVRAIFDAFAEGVRCLTLTGPPGVGKTRLALAAANELAAVFPGGVHVLLLASLTDPSQVGPAMAAALGLEVGDDPALVAALERGPERRATLLVLDNLEHLTEAAPFLASVLRASSALRILGTSRVRLRIDGEHERVAPPLQLPNVGEPLDPDSLLAIPAIRLFVHRARQHYPPFRLTETNVREIVELCRRLDGLPLAIELAAARIKVLSPGQVLDRLAEDLSILSGGGLDAPERSRSMQATIDWSYEALSSAEQRAFRMLGVFAGGFSLQAAEATGIELDTLGRLVDASVVYRFPPTESDEDSSPRFGLLETIRSHALALLTREDELDAARRRHIGWLQSILEPANNAIYTRRQVEYEHLFERELGNIRAAMEWAVAAREADLAQRLASTLRGFCHIRTVHLREGVRHMRRALAVDGARPETRARCLAELAMLSFPVVDPSETGAFLSEAESLIEGSSDIDAHLLVKLMQTTHCLFTRDYGRGSPIMEEWLKLAATHPHNDAATKLAGVVFAGLLHHSGDLEGAEAAYRDLLNPELFDAGPYYLKMTRMQLADVAREKGDLATALSEFGVALETLVTSQDVWTTGRCFGKIGVVQGDLKNWENAAICLGAAQATFRNIGGLAFVLDQLDFDQTTMAGIAAVGKDAWDLAWNEGGALSAEAAGARVVAIARGETEPTAGPPPGTAMFDESPGDALIVLLTPRQRAVLRGLMRGLTNAEIGVELSISGRTVEEHVAQVTGKFGVRSRREAAAFAVRHRVLDPPPA